MLGRIEGYVIVSADGMIADANGVMPDSIRNDADQRFLQAGLDHAAALVHGRHSHEGGPRALRRKRLVVTRQIAAIAPDPTHPHARLWNPTGCPLHQAAEALGALTARSPLSAAPKCSVCSYRSMTRFISRMPRCEDTRGAGLRRRRPLRVAGRHPMPPTASSPVRGAISTPRLAVSE